ncbi:hypothetical protein IAT38_007375 [Cryptococcus sp. DSM 104549]
MPSVAPSLLAVLQRAQKPDQLGKLIQEALVLVESVMDQLGEDTFAISFNGGKDCTVLLHIYAAALYARHAQVDSHLKPKSSPSIIIPEQSTAPTPTTSAPLPPSDAPAHSASARTPPPPPPSALPAPSPTHPNSSLPTPPSPSHPHSTHHHPPTPLPYPPIRSIYITAPNPFAELDEFVLSCTGRYGLDLYRFGGGMKAALEEWLACGGGKGVKAVLVGTRQGDPNGEVQVLAHTDPSWPSFLRVHPILHWTYSDVWDFLLELQVPYCSLYDEGYTSLGSTTNTSPNPLLKNPEAPSGWDPAYKLQDATQERAGRHK